MPDERKIYTVTELNNISRLTLEGISPDGLWLGGELRDVKFPASGHVYFAVTDDESKIDAVMWRSSATRLDFTPENGMKVEFFGTPTLYEKTGRYQFMARRMLPVGEGARAIAFRQLKERLEEEGLFSAEHKRPIPEYPFRIGVVTSGTGAAIRDIINVFTRRAPYVSIILRPAKVQGEGAVEDISNGIIEINEYANVDLLIVGRGGGSEEDLWCFNDEGLARTIFDSELPIISAVGHEIDYTIADFVADLRAPTPSAAAEIAVKDTRELSNTIIGYIENARKNIGSKVDRRFSRLEDLVSRAAWRAPLKLIHDYEQRLDDLTTLADKFISLKAERNATRFNNLTVRLKGLAASSTIKRGYAVVSLNGKTVTQAIDLETGDEIDIRFSDGVRRAKITN